MSETVHLWASSYSPTQLVKWAVSAMPSSSSFSFISATNASLGARHISGQPQRRVRTGGEDGAVEQLTHRDRFVNHQPHHAATVDIAVVGDVDGHGEGVVQLLLL